MPEIDKEAIKSQNKSVIEGGTGRLFQHQVTLNQWAIEPSRRGRNRTHILQSV